MAQVLPGQPPEQGIALPGRRITRYAITQRPDGLVREDITIESDGRRFGITRQNSSSLAQTQGALETLRELSVPWLEAAPRPALPDPQSSDSDDEILGREELVRRIFDRDNQSRRRLRRLPPPPVYNVNQRILQDLFNNPLGRPLGGRRLGGRPRTQRPRIQRLRQDAQETSTNEGQGGQAPAAALEGECSICLEPLSTEVCRTLQCDHSFHRKCIDEWFRHNVSCANCRSPVL